MNKTVFLLLLQASISFSEPLLNISIEFEDAESARLHSYQLSEGQPTGLGGGEGDYRLLAVINGKDFLSPPFSISESSGILELGIPYTEGLSRLKLYKKLPETTDVLLLFDEEITGCTGDGKCDSHETPAGCPNDCAPGPDSDQATITGSNQAPPTSRIGIFKAALIALSLLLFSTTAYYYKEKLKAAFNFLQNRPSHGPGEELEELPDLGELDEGGVENPQKMTGRKTR